MARTSKKRKEEKRRNNKRFHAGIYARLSVEADTRKNESIDMQIALVKEYIREHLEIELFDCYVDLGKTGTNFHRKEFERMMEDVRKKRINCIIVKDLSRFGRNHVETGNYIQKIFPFMGVRFIAVTDGIDTFQITADDLTTNLKNLLNEMYAKDIAAKVKSGKQLCKEQGSYAGGVPPYGYTVRWEDGKRKLSVHRETAEVVRDIYEMYLSGKGLKQIVEVLYAGKIHRPAVYKRTGHVFCQEGELLEQWSSATVKLILTNPVYAGNCCYTNDAVVNKDVFFQVTKMFGDTTKKDCNREEPFRKVPVSEDIYDGILFCGDCGKRMRRTVNVKELRFGDMVYNYSYYCLDSGRIDDLRCPQKGIGLAALNELVKNTLQQESFLSGLYQERLKEREKRRIEDLEKQFRQEILKCERKVKNRKRQNSELYIKYHTGEISLKEYEERRKENRKWLYEVLEWKEGMIKQLHNMEQKVAVEGEVLEGSVKCNGEIVLTKEILQMLIRRIEVYQNHQIKIIFADL